MHSEACFRTLKCVFDDAILPCSFILLCMLPHIHELDPKGEGFQYIGSLVVCEKYELHSIFKFPERDIMRMPAASREL